MTYLLKKAPFFSFFQKKLAAISTENANFVRINHFTNPKKMRI